MKNIIAPTATDTTGTTSVVTGSALGSSKVGIDVAPGGSESTLNSSTATLTSGSTFTGTGERNNFPNVGVMVKTDQPGTLYFDFSSNGTDWDSRYPVNGFRVAANTPEFHTAVKLGRYFRAVFTNDTDGGQTFMRLTTYYGNNFAPSVLALEQTISTDADTILVRPATNIDLDLARQHISGQSAGFFFGHNTALQNGTFEDVWEGSNGINWQTVAAKVKVASSDAADTAAGLGCQSVEIHGLSATGVDQDEVIVLNGTTAVESALTYSRINLMHNEAVGTYGGSHQGDVECRVTNATFANGALLSVMKGLEGAAGSSVQYGYGEAQNGFFSVPLGKVLYITRIEVIPNASKPIDIILYEREGILTVADSFLPRRVIWSAVEVETPVEKEFKSHIKIKALTDLWFRAEGNGATSGVAVWLDYYLVDANSSGA
jgi:hypothetical protein